MKSKSFFLVIFLLAVGGSLFAQTNGRVEMRREVGENAVAHPAKAAGWGGAATGAEITRLGWGARLVGAGAGWAWSLMAPAHGLGTGRNASGDFRVRRLFAGLILRFTPMEQGFPVLFGMARLGRGGVLVVAVKGPAGTCSSGNRAGHTESKSEASS